MLIVAYANTAHTSRLLDCIIQSKFFHTGNGITVTIMVCKVFAYESVSARVIVIFVCVCLLTVNRGIYEIIHGTN